MLNDWLGSNTVITPNEISLITKIIRLSKSEEETPGLQLVWSGPLQEGIPIRSTEQVIIDLIENARESLFISSFAVYKAKKVLKKIEDALDKGIQVSILLETPESSHFKIKIDPLKILPKAILDSATILIWPFNKRVKNEKDDGGSLHTKFIIQDDSRLFISSANLTESAFERNIELGVLISDRKVIKNLKDHINNLIIKNILIKIVLGL